MALVATGLVIGCTSGATEEPVAERAAPHPVVVEEPEEPVPEPAAKQPAGVLEPEPSPSFDPATATEATARIVAVHNHGWVACGIVHTVGAIEVEVLQVGEPPPRLALYISCPADMGRRSMLVVGEIVRVRLFARKQMWPTPPVDLPDELVVRYVESMEWVTALNHP
jgi:hypothetical protein